MGFGAEEADRFLQEALEFLQRGDRPFPPKYPVRREKVIQRLTSWRRDDRRGAIRPPEPLTLEDLANTSPGLVAALAGPKFAGRPEHDLAAEVLRNLRPEWDAHQPGT